MISKKLLTAVLAVVPDDDFGVEIKTIGTGEERLIRVAYDYDKKVIYLTFADEHNDDINTTH